MLGNKAAKKCFTGLFETYTSRKFRNLKRAARSVLVHSIQLFTHLFKRQTCNFVYTPSHYRVYVSTRTYYLSSRFIFRQILFNVVCKALSRVQIRACLHGGRGPQVGEVTRLSI